MNYDWFDPSCPHCVALKKDIENGLVEEVNLDDMDWEEEDEADTASAHVSDLLLLGRIEEAAAAAVALEKEFPDRVNGLERQALVAKFQGDHARAIQLYESAIAFTHAHEGYDDEDREYLRECIRELREKLP